MLILFFIFWLILNGKITAEILVLGLILAGGAYLFARVCFGYTWRTEVNLLRIMPLAAVYLVVLAGEIFKSNIRVMTLVWFKNIPIQPEVVKFRLSFRTDAARAVLANSISITPGTITASVQGDEFYVHCLKRDMIDGIENSTFVKLLRRMEEKLV